MESTGQQQQQQQQPPGQRDMVFCHECENEWYRDEHGLTCPDCHSDFTEIIEPQHDPREEMIDDQEDHDLPPLHSLYNHNPWTHQEDNAPDPDEDDISNLQWQSDGPGRMSFQFTRSFSPTELHAGPAQQDPLQGNLLMQNFATMLNGIVGGRPTTAAMPQQPGSGQQPGSPQTGDAPSQPDDQGPRASQPGEPGLHTYQGGGPGWTWTASTRVYPRDANNAQPNGQVLDDLPTFLNSMFPLPGSSPRGRDPLGMGPLGLFAGLFNPANMQHGDAVYSQEALDRIVSQLMEQNTAGNAPGPASADAIANLPQKTISESDVDEQGKADCSICMDEAHLGDKVTVLPCSHWFHKECIEAWLGEHDTCPHCRQGIMPKDGPSDASSPRNPDQAPMNAPTWGQGEGTRDDPWTVPESPARERRRSSNSAGSSSRNTGGLFGRMRDAFGGSSSGPSRVYTASFAFFEAIWEAGITHCFVNLGSDHPSIIEAIVKGQNEKKGQFPRIITCPNEMVALSMADGFARLTNKPQCVIVHVDVGTQGLGAAVHNASCGRAPVLIFAGLSPFTIEGEHRGSRTEYIHWIQDIPDQKAIVAQYCRYTGEIKRGSNVKQLVNRALSFATSEPKGPVYLVGAREPMEEDLEPYSLDQKHWTPVEPAALAPKQVQSIAEMLVNAEAPLVVTGYSGRNHAAVGALVDLADTVKGLKVLDTGGSDMCFPANHPAWLGLRYGVEDHIKTADVILVIDCDVPWIPTQCHPKEGAKIIHIDVDPLKQQMPVFYIKAIARYRADAEISVSQIISYIKSNCKDKVTGSASDDRWKALQDFHQQRIETIAAQAEPGDDGNYGCSYLVNQVRKACPPDTIWAIEAVTNTAFVADQIQATLPGSWINCGGGGLGWSGGGALGIKLASDFEHGKGKGKFVCQIVGDGTYLFSVPGSVYWIAQRYNIPILTIVLNNKGWNAPRKSLLLVHPEGDGSKVSNEELNISFAPTPDYSGIAKAASGGQCWAGVASTVKDLQTLLPEAIEAVKSGRCAVLDAHLDGPQGKFPGDKTSLVG